MNVIQIKSGVVSQLRFQVDVEGTDTPVKEVRLSVITESVRISYRGALNESVAVFGTRGLENFVKPGHPYDFDLEVFIGNQHFVPLQGKIQVIEEVSVNALPVGATSLGEVKVEVKSISGDNQALKSGGITETIFGGSKKRSKKMVESSSRATNKYCVVKDISADVLKGFFNDSN